MNKSAISRVKRVAWNTVHRWLERAGESCRRFSDRTMKSFELVELQADEIRTFVETKRKPTWVFTALEVTTRLWSSTIVGRRSYKNTLRLFRDVFKRSVLGKLPLIVTDGFEFYETVVRRVFPPSCLYAQVLKTRRKDRIIKVERRNTIGSQAQFETALLESEDSSTLNTSFIERLNLTVRQSSAYLGRRTACHSRSVSHLRDHLELQRCHYNFIRRHSSLRFGSTVRTPAMQAGIATKRLSFREVFLSSCKIADLM